MAEAARAAAAAGPAPDPIREAKAYQDSLLAALGADDPAEAQAATPARIRLLIAEAGRDLRTRSEPGEWSVIECIGHVVDAEIVTSARYRWILAEDEPDLVGYDQARWVDALRHRGADPAMLAGLFEALRAANIALWLGSSAAERARAGRHRERGLESFELLFRMLAGHDRVHLGQADRALAAARLLGNR